MIKSNFQLEKEKERSILDCITSITGKLDEATVVGFSAPMGGIANPQPSWATQRAKALTNPSLPLPLKPGQSTPFIAKGPFIPQEQGQQSTQSQSSMAATIPAGALPVATGSALQVGQQAAEAKGKDAWERSRAGTFDYKNEVLPSANYDPVVINARKVLATPYETPSSQPSRIDQTLARARASSADTQDLLASGRDLITKSQAGHERSVAARTELRQTMDNMPSYLPQTSKPSLPDINDLSPDERYRRTMAAGNFSGNSLSDTVDMKERAAQQTKERAAQKTRAAQQTRAAKGVGQSPVLPFINSQREYKFDNSRSREPSDLIDMDSYNAGKYSGLQPSASEKEINMTPQERDARRVAREAAEDRQEGETISTKVGDKTVYRQEGGEKNRIHNRLQAQRDARNAREADRLRGEEEAQKNREKARDINRRRYSRPIYDQDSGEVTDSYSGKTIGFQRGNQSGGNMSSGRSGLGGGGGGGGGSPIPESFKGSLNRLDEIAAGISAIAGTELGKHIKDFAVNAGSEAINFAKNYAPKIGYIALTPPRTLAAAATGRLSGLGYSKEGAIDTFNYYRNMIGGLGKAGGTLLTGLAGTAAGQKVGTAAGKAAGKVASWVGPLGIKVGKDVVGALDPAGHVDAFADEAALNTGAALWDPRMLSYNIKSKPLAQEKN